MYTQLKNFVLLAMMLMVGLVYISANGQDIKTENQAEVVQRLPAQNPHSFIGTWNVQTQITNCAGIPVENFSKFVSIEAGGTAHEMSNSLPPSQRTVAFGVWEHLEQRNFVYALRFFRFTPMGTFSNIVQAKWSVLMGDDGDSYTADATIQVMLPNGTVVANLCGSENGTRMVIPN
jgi:hypothetical protein